MAKLNDTEIGKRRWDESKRTRTGKVPGYQSVNDPEVGVERFTSSPALFAPSYLGRSPDRPNVKP